MSAARFRVCQQQVLIWLALPALVHLFGLAVHGQSACPDEYLYTQQPPEDIVCNPYLRSVLMLDCAVTGPYDVHIQWYFSMTSMNIFDDDTVLLSNSSKYVLAPRAFENGVGLGLTVNNLNEDEDVGMFWCQATIPTDDTFLTSSTTFQLHGQDFYSAIPFICPPNVFLRSSDTRCATIMDIPTEPELTTHPPSPSPTPSTSIAPEPTTPSRAITTVPPRTQMSSHMGTSSSPLSSSTLKPSPELPSTVTGPNTPNPIEPTESETITKPTKTDDSVMIQADLVLYSVLGVVAFLIALCAILAIVIFFLCRGRQCQRVDLEGADQKETGFDHLSTQSDPLQSALKFKRRAAHMLYRPPDISMQISSDSRSLRGSGDYAEIGPPLVTLRSQALGHDYSEIPEILPPYFRSVDPTSDQQTQESCISPDDENPYDIPIVPPDLRPPQEAQSDTTGDSSSADSSETRNYHILERIPLSPRHPAPTSPPPSLPQEDTSPSPPVSPHNYHVLEDPPYQDTKYPHTAALEKSTSRLQTIPEHPYHVLEEKSKSKSRECSTESEGISIEQEIKESTPGFTDPEIDERSSPETKDLEDGEYDRLVGPPHLYHILERSPSEIRPRIREFPNSYDHLEARGCQETLAIRFPSPPMEETTLSSLTNSDGGSPGEMFDDPQYTVSPKHKPVGKSKSDIGGVQPSRQHFRNRVKEMQVIDLAKYCGDYERDPSYMAWLNRSPVVQNRAKATEDCTDYAYTPLSEFNTLRGSSLPDIPHIYQALEAGTKDPLEQYEKLKRLDLIGKETAI